MAQGLYPQVKKDLLKARFAIFAVTIATASTITSVTASCSIFEWPCILPSSSVISLVNSELGCLYTNTSESDLSFSDTRLLTPMIRLITMATFLVLKLEHATAVEIDVLCMNLDIFGQRSPTLFNSIRYCAFKSGGSIRIDIRQYRHYPVHSVLSCSECSCVGSSVM